MLGDSSVHVVKAIHNFKGSNNDELCFKKGDIITVTQTLDGGWWEGTLNDVTGWFPSNYVKEVKHDSLKSARSVSHSQDVTLSPKLENTKMYRAIVFKDIVDTENNHLNEIKNLVCNYLNPLKDKNILSDEEYSTLKNNIEDVCACNVTFLSALEEVQEKPPRDQRIGGVFMQMAPQIKKVNFVYCANHPKATAVVEKHKDKLEKFLEEHGGAPPGILILTTGLSSPFRRLEKYPALLQELQRHTEENHVDRGDTHRAIFVYRDIAAACVNIRRQKENELEVMSGNIKGWEGENIQTLGEIIHLGSVVFLTEDQERKDRYLVAFPQNLVILSVSPRINSFIYEGKLPLSGVTVQKLEPCDTYQYAFEITGSMIQRIIVICASQESLDQWLNVLQHKICSNDGVSPSSKVLLHTSPHLPQTHKSMPSSPVNPVPQQSPVQQLSGFTQVTDDQSTPQMTRITPAHRINNKVWTSWSLRPHAPLRPSLFSNKGEVLLRRSNSRRKEKVPEEKNYEGDMRILQVIEAYCTSAKSRYTLNSAFLDTPQVLIAEEEKIMLEEFKDGTMIIKEKNLVDTIYALKDQIQELKSETSQLFKYFEEEKKARKRLELLLQKHILGNCEEKITCYFDS